MLKKNVDVHTCTPTIYEQLQEVLNGLIANGWKPWGKDDMDCWYKIVVWEIGDSNVMLWCTMRDYFFSAHDLFSKNSWFMEAVEWKGKWKMWVKIWPIEWYADVEYEYVEIWDKSRSYHAMMMSAMTAEEKIRYVLANIVILWPHYHQNRHLPSTWSIRIAAVPDSLRCFCCFFYNRSYLWSSKRSCVRYTYRQDISSFSA